MFSKTFAFEIRKGTTIYYEKNNTVLQISIVISSLGVLITYFALREKIISSVILVIMLLLIIMESKLFK